MEKSGLSAQGFRVRRNGSYTKVRTEKLYVKPIPSDVKLSDFVRVEADMEKMVELSKKKSK